MTMKTECMASIYSYASQERQNNAALTGEHLPYVSVVLTLLRGHYHQLLDGGVSEWSIPDYMVETLNSMKPY